MQRQKDGTSRRAHVERLCGGAEQRQAEQEARRPLRAVSNGLGLSQAMSADLLVIPDALSRSAPKQSLCAEALGSFTLCAEALGMYFLPQSSPCVQKL